MTGTDIIKRATVEEIVGHRNAAIAAYTQALLMMEQANAAHQRATNRSYGIPSDMSLSRGADVKAYTKKLDEAVWRHLVDMTTLYDLMDVAERKKFDKQCEEAPPEVTIDNVIATMGNLMGRSSEIFERSIINTFEALPRDYKSNDGFKYGQRIIFDYAFDTRHVWSFYGHTYAAERLKDLDRIFHVMDGKAPPGHMQGAVQAVYEACRKQEPFDIETEFFRIKGFRKGTLHIWPKRRDLIDRANRALAAHYGNTLARPAA